MKSLKMYLKILILSGVIITDIPALLRILSLSILHQIVLPKIVFFNYLLEGDCIPLKLTSARNIYYKLYKIPASADASIATTMISTAQREYKLYKMEGKPLPEFDWIDLDKKIYTRKKYKRQYPGCLSFGLYIVKNVMKKYLIVIS